VNGKDVRDVHVPAVEYHEADSLEAAAELLGRYAPDARLLAGGTDVLVDLKTARAGAGAGHLISIGGIPGLRGVTEAEAGLVIGALTTLSELDRAPVVAERYPVLKDATSRMAAPQIRNAATVGGNLAGAVPCADLPPVLLVCDAAVVLWSPRGERTVSITDLLVGPRRTSLEPDEVLQRVLVPAPAPGFGAAYARFALRDGNAIAVAAVGASLRLDEAGVVTEARVSLGAVAPTPRLIAPPARPLVGRRPSEDAIADAAAVAMQAAQPISDVRGSAEYRRTLVGVLAGRAIDGARRRARGAAP
jgi:CO/xanthine dehydrogenase FAD-binding subunit